MKTFAGSLRAARSLLNLSRKKVDELAGLASGTVARLERAEVKQVPREALKLQAEFEKKGVVFDETVEPFTGCVRWKNTPENDPLRSSQFRAARAVVNMSQLALAKRARIDKNFIARLELDRPKFLTLETAAKVENTLRELGVELIPANQSFGPGVRWTKEATEDRSDSD